MAHLSSQIKYGFLVYAASLATGSITLEQSIQNLSNTQAARLITGTTVTAASGPSYSTTLSAVVGQIRPDQVFDLWSELLQYVIDARTWLTKLNLYGLNADDVNENGWPDPLPAQVSNPTAVTTDDIVSRIRAVTLYPKILAGSDYFTLRTPPTMQTV